MILKVTQGEFAGSGTTVREAEQTMAFIAHVQGGGEMSSFKEFQWIPQKKI